MRFSKTHLTFALITALIWSCDSKTTSFEIEQLEGCWYDSSKNVYEEWKRVSPNHITGQGFEVNGNDTVVYEVLEIKDVNGTLTYLADVEQVMGQGIVDFPLVSRNQHSLVFINKEHDYPQVLHYSKTSDDSLVVTLGTFPLMEDKDPVVLRYGRVK